MVLLNDVVSGKVMALRLILVYVVVDGITAVVDITMSS